MLIICEKRIDEALFANNKPVSSVWTEWQVLKCPLCEKINVLESYSIADEDEEWTDSDGTQHFSEVIHTKALYPTIDPALPKPHSNIPKSLLEDYEEARAVFSVSARGAAALLRLVIQKLCKHLGESGKDLNTDIASLVQKGLPIHIQQALDIVRVIGNEAVHPGEINTRDNPEVVKRLFNLVNEIVEDRIGKVQKQAEIKKVYEDLPKEKLDYIKKRDKSSQLNLGSA